MHFIEISNIFKSEKKRYKVTAVLKLLVVFALLGFFLSNKPMYHVQTDFYLKRMGFVFLACFWMVFVTVCDIRLSQKVDRAFVIILGVIAPAMGWILSEKTKKCRIEYRFFWKCTTKNTNTIIVYKEMMLYNLTRLNSSFWKVERSNAKNECY